MADLATVAVPESNYGETVVLEEYNGVYSLVSARTANDGKVWKNWAFPQGPGKKPKETALPVKVILGGDVDTAVNMLQKMIDVLGGGDDIDF